MSGDAVEEVSGTEDLKKDKMGPSPGSPDLGGMSPGRIGLSMIGVNSRNHRGGGSNFNESLCGAIEASLLPKINSGVQQSNSSPGEFSGRQVTSLAVKALLFPRGLVLAK